MGGKRSKDPELPKIAGAFVRELRETSGDVIHELAVGKRVPLNKIYEGHIQAAFQLLHMALMARRALRMNPKSTIVAPALRAKEGVLMMEEVMEIVADELRSIDPYHDYSVLIVKRERGSPTLL